MTLDAQRDQVFIVDRHQNTGAADAASAVTAMMYFELNLRRVTIAGTASTTVTLTNGRGAGAPAFTSPIRRQPLTRHELLPFCRSITRPKFSFVGLYRAKSIYVKVFYS
jgi:hypothetical protein